PIPAGCHHPHQVPSTLAPTNPFPHAGPTPNAGVSLGLRVVKINRTPLPASAAPPAANEAIDTVRAVLVSATAARYRCWSSREHGVPAGQIPAICLFPSTTLIPK